MTPLGGVGGDGVPSAWTLGGQRIAVEFALSVYSVDAALRAAYKLTDRCYIYLSPSERQDGVVVVISPKTAQTPSALEALVGELSNELLDQRLRESLAKEFGPLQQLIAARAFSDTAQPDSALKHELNRDDSPHPPSGR